MAVETPHHSRNFMFWKGPHPALTAARKQPGWADFHRECGRHGLYFDDIDPAQGRGFRATAFRLKRGTEFTRIHVADGRGATPIAALLATAAVARANGFPLPEDVDQLLSSAPASIDVLDVLGDAPPAAVDPMEILG